MRASLFKSHQRVVHVATGKVYRIVDPPSRLCIEATGEAGYSYTLADASDIALWVRPQRQMEDGRFVPERA